MKNAVLTIFSAFGGALLFPAAGHAQKPGYIADLYAEGSKGTLVLEGYDAKKTHVFFSCPVAITEKGTLEPTFGRASVEVLGADLSSAHENDFVFITMKDLKNLSQINGDGGMGGGPENSCNACDFMKKLDTKEKSKFASGLPLSSSILETIATRVVDAYNEASRGKGITPGKALKIANELRY
jgi:hypothetical protein